MVARGSSIGDNKLRGTVPSSIGKLKKLSLLYGGRWCDASLWCPHAPVVRPRRQLQMNELRGTLPKELGTLKKLSVVCVRHGGGVSAGTPHRCVCRFLDNNKFSGHIPEGIQKFRSLRTL